MGGVPASLSVLNRRATPSVSRLGFSVWLVNIASLSFSLTLSRPTFGGLSKLLLSPLTLGFVLPCGLHALGIKLRSLLLEGMFFGVFPAILMLSNLLIATVGWVIVLHPSPLLLVVVAVALTILAALSNGGLVGAPPLIVFALSLCFTF